MVLVLMSYHIMHTASPLISAHNALQSQVPAAEFLPSLNLRRVSWVAGQRLNQNSEELPSIRQLGHMLFPVKKEEEYSS